jgi:gas vesicle protein
MGKFIRTLLLGVGIGLLIAPKRGEEMRQLLMERFQQMGGSLAGNTQQGQSSSQTAANNNSAEASKLRHVAEAAEEHSMMYTPPTANYEPAYPDYVNPEQKPS